MQNAKLRLARQQKQWTQAAAAEKIGISPLTYMRWEQGTQTPYPKTLHDLCEAFDLSPEELGFEDAAMLDERHIPDPEETKPVERKNLLSPSSSMQTHVGETFPGDSATWFSEKLVQLLFGNNRWCAERCLELEKSLDQELRRSEEIRSLYEAEAFHLSRRHALLVLSALPKAFLTTFPGNGEGIEQELLPSCAASIISCWHLMKGKEIGSIERALSRSVSWLFSLAKQSSNKYQPMAAYLAAQSCLLLGLVALHRSHFSQWLSYCEHAVEYATLAKDRTLHVFALVFLGCAYKDNEKRAEMLQMHQEAARYLREVPPLLRSKVLAELARSLARNGQERQAVYTLKQAREVFPATVDEVPCFVAADCGGIYQLILLEGLTYIDLGERKPGYFQKAGNALAQFEVLPASMVVPDRLRLEAINQQARVAVQVGNLEQFRRCLLEGIKGAKALGSEMRRQEVVAVFQEARSKWSHESKVLELADLLL